MRSCGSTFTGSFARAIRMRPEPLPLVQFTLILLPNTSLNVMLLACVVGWVAVVALASKIGAALLSSVVR